MSVLFQPIFHNRLCFLSIARPSQGHLCAEKTSIVSVTKENCQVGTYTIRRVPNQRLPTIIVPTRQSQFVSVGADGSLPSPLLTFPKFTWVIMRVDSIITEFITVPMTASAPLSIVHSQGVIQRFSHGRVI